MAKARMSEAMTLLEKADKALQDVRLRTSPSVRVDDEERYAVNHRLERIDGDLLDKVRSIMAETTNGRDRQRLIDALGRINREFDFIAQALTDGMLPMAPNEPWPPTAWVNEAEMAEDAAS